MQIRARMVDEAVEEICHEFRLQVPDESHFHSVLTSGEGHLVLDETPIGVWAELEGPPDWIDAMLIGLGIAPELCSTDSYGKLFLRWKDETRSPAENLTFDEVGAVAV